MNELCPRLAGRRARDTRRELPPLPSGPWGVIGPFTVDNNDRRRKAGESLSPAFLLIYFALAGVAYPLSPRESVRVFPLDALSIEREREKERER